jgi:hypothetical protein
MTEAKHTPGPWFTGHVGTEALWVGPDHQSLFVCTVPWECDNSRSNARANARLISTAPELLKALQELLAFHERPAGLETAVAMDDEAFGQFLKGISTNSDELTTRARAAIAKATGEQR